VRICFLVLYSDQGLIQPDQVVERSATPHALAAALDRRGHDCHVVAHFRSDHQLEADGVVYHLVRPGPSAELVGRWATKLFGLAAPYFEPALRALRVVSVLGPQVIHFHGLTLDLNLHLALDRAARLDVPVFVQFHGGFPPPNRLRRWLQRHNLARAAGLFFTTRSHAFPWLEAGVIESWERVHEVMETSSPFERMPRAVARAATGMHGEPVYLWAARLHPHKDPLTALRAFEVIAEQWPEARLYMCYLTNELESELRGFVAERSALSERVRFMGRLAKTEMPAVYSSADFLVQASYREFSGQAVLEAMSCGVIPIVTCIPSFWKMTDGGQYGAVFEPGNWQALARCALSFRRADIEPLSNRVWAHFQRALSFPALAQRLERLYDGVA
jgi:glycosyltransferase involved in cell wall biosynthesis